MSNARGPEKEEGMKNLTNNPMDQGIAKRLDNIRAAHRCGAKTRSGGTCQCPAIRSRNRCRLHGGRSSGAPKGRGNGNYKDGTFTEEAVQERQWLRSVVRTYGKLEPS
jgi:glucans biosynthesis protein